jgi:PAS domain S-box-containing protein
VPAGSALWNYWPCSTFWALRRNVRGRFVELPKPWRDVLAVLSQVTPLTPPVFNLESSPDSYLLLSPELKIIGVTNAYLKATMTRRADIIGRHLFDVFPDNPDDIRADGVSNLRASLQRVLDTKSPDEMPTQKYDVRRPHEEGGGFELRYWKPVNTPVLSDDGQVLYIIHKAEDVTEVVRREQESESALQLRILVQGVTDYAIYMLDPEGYVASWNPGAERIKGYSATEIIGEHFSRFYSEEDRKSNMPKRALETAIREGRFEKESFRYRRDGSRFLAHVVIDPIRDERGNVIAFAKITRDITEREENRKALERTREQLFQSQKVEAIGKLTGGVAHDFNNLLMVIQSSLELLRKRTPDNAQITPLLQNALRATERGAALTQRMLAFARKQDVEKRVIDLSNLIAEVCELLERSLGPSYEIGCQFDGKIPNVLADPNQLESALLNLAFNARDAMPDGGRITILVRVAHNPASDLPSGDYVSIALKDEGHGMDAETLRQATDPFFTTKGVGKGTGLGLSMVQGMAEQAGGAFRLTSVAGSGTTAEILLPEAKALAETEGAKPQDVAGSDRALVIVAVDDDSLVLMNTTAMLEDLGHTVLEANSAREALELLKDTKADLVITDHAMPGTTGLQLAKMIRETKPDLPILLATGYAEIDPAAGIQLPRIGKPFLQNDLKLAIDKVMQSA